MSTTKVHEEMALSAIEKMKDAMKIDLKRLTELVSATREKIRNINTMNYTYDQWDAYEEEIYRLKRLEQRLKEANLEYFHDDEDSEILNLYWVDDANPPCKINHSRSSDGPIPEEEHPPAYFYKCNEKVYNDVREVPQESGLITQEICILGGMPRKKPFGSKKTNKPRVTPGIKSAQLGQINRWVPYDRPVTAVLRFNGSLITDGSGTLTSRFALRNPLSAFNGSGAYVNAVDFASLFDQYKPMRWSFQFEPAPTGPAKGAIVVAMDYDAPNNATPNYANIVNYGGYRIFNVGQQFEITTGKLPELLSGLDTANDPPTPIIVHKGGWIDAATSAAVGCCFMGGVNLGNSVVLGSFTLTMLLGWRFRR